jgi:O-antigen/teichoic acid export membrane protein
MQFENPQTQRILNRFSCQFMSKAKLTFQSALWNHAGKVLEYLLMYLTSIVIARGLGVQENGRFVGLFSLSQLLLVLCSFGLETSLNKFIPQLTSRTLDAQTAFIVRRAILIRIAAFFGVAMLSYLAIHSLTIPFFSASSQALLLVFAFTGIRSLVPLFATALTAQLRTALTARINLVIRIIEIVVVLASGQLTVENLFMLFAATSGLHVAAYAVFSRMNLLTGAAPVDMKPIVMFGGIYWLNTLVDFILGRQGDVLFLSNLLPDASQAGLYDVAYSIAQLASLAMTVGLSGVTFATFAKLAVSDQQTMDKFYAFSIRIISLLTIPAYAFLLFHTSDVLNVLYSSHYLAATTLVQGILAFRICARVFGGPENAEYLLSQGRVGTVVAFGAGAAAVNILLNIVLIPRLGGMGSVIASGVGNVLVNALAAFAVFRISSNKMQTLFWAKLTAISIGAAFVCARVIPSESAFGLIASACLYSALLMILLVVAKPLAPSDAEWLSRIDRRLSALLLRFTRSPVAHVSAQ